MDTAQYSKPSTVDPAESPNEERVTKPVSGLAPSSAKTGAPSVDTLSVENSRTSGFTVFDPSASLIQSTLRGSEAFQESEADTQAPSAVDNQLQRALCSATFGPTML